MHYNFTEYCVTLCFSSWESTRAPAGFISLSFCMCFSHSRIQDTCVLHDSLFLCLSLSRTFHSHERIFGALPLVFCPAETPPPSLWVYCPTYIFVRFFNLFCYAQRTPFSVPTPSVSSHLRWLTHNSHLSVFFVIAIRILMDVAVTRVAIRESIW